MTLEERVKRLENDIAILNRERSTHDGLNNILKTLNGVKFFKGIHNPKIRGLELTNENGKKVYVWANSEKRGINVWYRHP